MKRFRGYKRAENYVRSIYAAAERIKADPTVSREDVEAFEIDRERKREQLDGFKTVERIVSQRNADANVDVQYDHRRQNGVSASCSAGRCRVLLNLLCIFGQWSIFANGKD